jgi:hypothetical protein
VIGCGLQLIAWSFARRTRHVTPVPGKPDANGVRRRPAAAVTKEVAE